MSPLFFFLDTVTTSNIYVMPRFTLVGFQQRSHTVWLSTQAELNGHLTETSWSWFYPESVSPEGWSWNLKATNGRQLLCGVRTSSRYSAGEKDGDDGEKGHLECPGVLPPPSPGFPWLTHHSDEPFHHWCLLLLHSDKNSFPAQLV